MSPARTVVDVIGLLAFLAAALLAFAPLSDGRRRLPRQLIVLGLGLYVLVELSDVASDLGISSAGHAFEDYIEALFPLVVLGVLFARTTAQRLTDLAQTQRALQRSHDLMLDIVDGAPSGIMFLDNCGKIAFANDAAKRMLDLVEDGCSTQVRPPAWKLAGVPDIEPGDLLPLVHPEPYDSRAISLEWANGLRSAFRVSGRPLSDAAGSLGGAVITFERVP